MKIIEQNESVSGEIPYRIAHIIENNGEERFLLYVGVKKEIALKIKNEELKNIYNDICISSKKEEYEKHNELIKDIFKDTGIESYTEFDTLICIKSDNFHKTEDYYDTKMWKDIEMQEMINTLGNITQYIKDKQIEQEKQNSSEEIKKIKRRP